MSSCRCILKKLVRDGRITQDEYDKLVRNIDDNQLKFNEKLKYYANKNFELLRTIESLKKANHELWTKNYEPLNKQTKQEIQDLETKNKVLEKEVRNLKDTVKRRDAKIKELKEANEHNLQLLLIHELSNNSKDSTILDLFKEINRLKDHLDKIYRKYGNLPIGEE